MKNECVDHNTKICIINPERTKNDPFSIIIRNFWYILFDLIYFSDSFLVSLE